MGNFILFLFVQIKFIKLLSAEKLISFSSLFRFWKRKKIPGKLSPGVAFCESWRVPPHQSRMSFAPAAQERRFPRRTMAERHRTIPGRGELLREVDVVERQRRGVLDLFHREAGTDLEYLDVARQLLVYRVVRRDVGHDDAQQIVDRPAHAVEIDDFGNAADDGPQLLEPFLVVPAGAQQHEHRHSDVQPGGVEESGPALDVALLLEALDAPPAGRGGQLDVPRDLGQRQVGVLLQQRKYLLVDPVHVFPARS